MGKALAELNGLDGMLVSEGNLMVVQQTTAIIFLGKKKIIEFFSIQVKRQNCES